VTLANVGYPVSPPSGLGDFSQCWLSCFSTLGFRWL